MFFNKLAEFKDIDEYTIYLNDGCMTTSFKLNDVNICYSITAKKD